MNKLRHAIDALEALAIDDVKAAHDDTLRKLSKLFAHWSAQTDNELFERASPSDEDDVAAAAERTKQRMSANLQRRKPPP
jgi:hypothetical protein